jgi:DNA-binding HxlR family transcriptional regulator
MAATADTASESDSGSDVSSGYRPERTEPVVTRQGDGAPAQMALLTDEYARSVLEALGDGPKRARELTDVCAGSRATVYRRLDRLEAAGFVTTETGPDPDGHHFRTFRLVRDTVTVAVEDGGLSVTAQ